MFLRPKQWTLVVSLTAGLLAICGCECSIESIKTTSLPPAAVGTAYEFRLTHNCEGKWTTDEEEWRLHDGTLPPGIALTRDGRLAGTPRTAGEYQFTVDLYYSWYSSSDLGGGGGSRDALRQFVLTVVSTEG